MGTALDSSLLGEGISVPVMSGAAPEPGLAQAGVTECLLNKGHRKHSPDHSLCESGPSERKSTFGPCGLESVKNHT
jgi:hypothetical protein